ncbi:MAG: hypothetical protein QG573_200 [Acidobacteriota bacterium]|nr:hypothetical protein [Acidobacteriota bacterium]
MRPIQILISVASLLLAACDLASVGADDPVAPVGGPADSPAAPVSKSELCGNGLDDNGNGDVDERCACKPGATQPCFPGPADRKGQGICQAGTQKCQGDAEFLSWGRCEGAVGPKAELCGDGIDQDCDGRDEACPSTGKCETFTAGVNARPVDIVWVIDQSGSMDDEIAAVRQNLNAFASFISAQKIDYHVILLAERYYENGICVPQPLAGAGCANGARFLQIEEYIDSHNSLSALTANAALIESFMRPGSIRHFVEVSDDESDLPASQFDAFFRARPGFQDYVFHSVVGLSWSDCVADIGQQYMTLSTLTKGLKFDICSANWQALFSELAKNVVTASTKYKLSTVPKPGTVKVWFDAAQAVPGLDYSYDPTVNQIVLLKAPAGGAKIKVCFEV